ncbi:MAG TPA: flagellar protein FlaG [Ureibacillus sp.]|nr:flagellar protein FlaG [Ureibacillus sp.]
MRIEAQGNSVEITTYSKSKSLNTDSSNQKILNTLESNNNDELVISKESIHQVVDSLNEIFNINNKNLKFVYHEGLKEYYVQLVNSETDEVVKEIPPKKLLDAYYEMQKLVGMIVDEKR